MHMTDRGPIGKKAARFRRADESGMMLADWSNVGRNDKVMRRSVDCLRLWVRGWADFSARKFTESGPSKVVQGRMNDAVIWERPAVGVVWQARVAAGRPHTHKLGLKGSRAHVACLGEGTVTLKWWVEMVEVVRLPEPPLWTRSSLCELMVAPASVFTRAKHEEAAVAGLRTPLCTLRESLKRAKICIDALALLTSPDQLWPRIAARTVEVVAGIFLESLWAGCCLCELMMALAS